MDINTSKMNNPKMKIHLKVCNVYYIVYADNTIPTVYSMSKMIMFCGF